MDLDILRFASPSLTHVDPLDQPLASTSSESEAQPTDPRVKAQNERLRAPLIKRRPIPRKGHTKSRRGCFGCKKRKIKCQETKPQCGNCEKAGMLCEYPRADVDSLVSLQQPAPQTVSLQATPTILSMKDLQSFHRFLFQAYPRLPVGASRLWTVEIPKVAHEYEYLIHSMLALGASDLGSTNFSSSALAHRVQAIELLKEAVSRPPKDRYEADARFATVMVLAHQSAYMPEALTDFFTMLRGCVLHGEQLDDVASYFVGFRGDSHLSTMDELLNKVRLESLDRLCLLPATASLAALEPHCKPGIEREYHSILKQLIQQAYVSPKNAYLFFTALYQIVGTISPQDFQHLTDRSNPICQILLSHFLATHYILLPVIYIEDTRDVSTVNEVLQGWIRATHATLPPSYRPLHEWPLSAPNLGSPWVHNRP